MSNDDFSHETRDEYIHRINTIYVMAELGASKTLIKKYFKLDYLTEQALNLKRARYRSGTTWVSVCRSQRLQANIIYHYYCHCSPENANLSREPTLEEIIGVTRTYKLNFGDHMADINRISALLLGIHTGELIIDRCIKCGIDHIYNNAHTYNYRSCPYCLCGSTALNRACNRTLL